MRSLRVRLTLWFALSFFAATAVFMGLTYHNLDQELRRKSFGAESTTRENWRLRGSLTEEEIRGIMNDLALAGLTFSLPLVLALLLLGWWIARKSLSPVGSLNAQLMAVNPRSLGRRVELPEADEQFRDLVRNLNDMLGRLQTSFVEMSEYAAKVAHELRTPLTIIRLKVEQSDGRIDPELAEELQGELHRLTHVVDQSLLIAKAEQGRLAWDRSVVDLAAMLEDLVRDFQMLAAEERREVTLEVRGGDFRVGVDPRYGKQILHSLLTNSLVHGRGPIRIRLRVAGRRVRVSILNPVRRRTAAGPQTLGLGLRVVRALVALPGDLGFRQHHGNLWHLSCLDLPLEGVPGAGRRAGEAAAVAAPVGDPGL